MDPRRRSCQNNLPYLQSEVNSAGQEVILADHTDSVLAVPSIPHHLPVSTSWPEWLIVLVIKVCEDYDHLHLLLGHQLPHGGHGAL